MKLKKLFLISVALVMGFSQFSAMAYNVTVGSACEAENEDDVYINKSSARLNNVSGSTKTITCPIYNIGAFSSKLLTAAITVVDDHNTQNITCDLVVTTSGLGGGYTSQSSSGSSFNPQVLGFANVSTYYNGGAYFRCYLPNQTTIINYRSN